MKIDRIELKNIGCFSERVVDFSDITVVYGENRSGKSTLVYALYFSIFGHHLNQALTAKDLCKKGEKEGTTELFFRHNDVHYKLLQATGRLPRLWQQTVGTHAWQPVNALDPDDLRAIIRIPQEPAALSSFFREGELIYFLQDVPAYNKTLLQNLVGIDDILITRSRFKKALSLAKEYKKAVQNASPKTAFDTLNLDLTQRQLSETENEFHRIDEMYKTMQIQSDGTSAVSNLIRREHDEKKRALDAAMKQLEALPSAESLIAEKNDVQKRWAEQPDEAPLLEELQRESGSLMHHQETIRQRLDRFKSLTETPVCPTCEQDIPGERIEEWVANLNTEWVRIASRQNEIEKKIATIRHGIVQRKNDQILLDKLVRQLREAQALDIQIKDLTTQMIKMASDLKGVDLQKPDPSVTPYGNPQDIEARRSQLQEQIVQYKVAIKSQEERLKRAQENKQHLIDSERAILICDIAHKAIDDAIQLSGGRVLEKVRQSIHTWIGHFSFLEEFDIEITDRELLPVIQAKGYQYKLNQMSKSERIFLYILLKLAIGDALGHMGLFILDDPADGLDAKRKETLAYLLSEVTQKRQVIVTTNDTYFADLFKGVHRIDLT